MKAKKTVTAANPRRQLERQAMILTKYCPVDGTNPVNCPLCDLRRLSIRARRAWVHRLTLEELQFLVLYHLSCSAVKTGTAPRPRKIPARPAKP